MGVGSLPAKSKSYKCSISGREFTISEAEERFLREFELEAPPISGSERWLYMVSLTIPFTFIHEQCPITGSKVLSRWSPQGAIRGVAPEWFWSDECDNALVGRDYDFNRSFFDQLIELAGLCHAPSINHTRCENSPYVNGCVGLKDCHLCFACESLRDCFYCALCANSEDLLFCCSVYNSELCYNCVDCSNIYGSRYLQDCRDCYNSFFCRDCIGCNNCFLCQGLRQAKDGYYIRNRRVSKEEWEEFLETADFGSHAAETRLSQEWDKSLGSGLLYETNVNNQGCEQVCQVRNSENCLASLYCAGCRDCKDLIFASDSRDCFSCLWAQHSERCYMSAGCFQAYNCLFCDGALGDARDQYYSVLCYNGCHDVFGCLFLKRKGYCILNKQYSKKEYSELLPRIIRHMKSTGEWGRPFPTALFGVPYRDSWAHFFFGEMSDEEILRRGLLTGSLVRESSEIASFHLADHLRDFTEKDCGRPLVCHRTARPYAVSKREWQVFLKHQAPIPREHWAASLAALQQRSIELCRKGTGIL